MWILLLLNLYFEAYYGIFNFERVLACQLEREGFVVSSRNLEALVFSLWSLFPAFCNYPVDTASGFEGIQEVLCETLRREPDLRGVICSSLQVSNFFHSNHKFVKF